MSVAAWWVLATMLVRLADARQLAAGGLTGSLRPRATYSTNPVCVSFRCVNPIFPGLMLHGQNMLSAQENKTWSCVGSRHIIEQAGICGPLVAAYEAAVPHPGEDGALSDSAAAQAKVALTAYVAHLSAIGYDFWDYREPWRHDECIQSVWKLACFTYFPKCNKRDGSRYMRPCGGACETYVKACQVQCCDEGARCSFVHHVDLADGRSLREEGYVDHPGPAPTCTGGVAPRAWLSLLILQWASMLIALASC